MNTDIEFVQKINLAYNAMCKPLCQQLKLPQTAFDILMFFGNNPEYRTVCLVDITCHLSELVCPWTSGFS